MGMIPRKWEGTGTKVIPAHFCGAMKLSCVLPPSLKKRGPFYRDSVLTGFLLISSNAFV